MRMLLGCAALLLTLAIVLLVAKTPLKSLGVAAPAAAVGLDAASAAQAAESNADQTATRDLPRKIQDDLVRAMQSAPVRGDETR